MLGSWSDTLYDYLATTDFSAPVHLDPTRRSLL